MKIITKTIKMIRNKVIGVIFNGDFNGNENTDIELD